MKQFDLHSYFQNISDQHVILSYKGAINLDLLNILLDMTEQRLAKNETKLSTRKRVFHILVEVLQNIYHYSGKYDFPNEEYFSIIFLIRKIENGYTIYAGNYIHNDEIVLVENRLDRANQLDEGELKAQYRLQLDQGLWSARGGAGLGFLDIIKKSGHAIDYQFIPVSEAFSFFSMEISV